MAKKETNPLITQLADWKEYTRALKTHGVVFCYNHDHALIYIKSTLPYLDKVAVPREWDESLSPWDRCLFPASDMTSFCTKYRKTSVSIENRETCIEMRDEKKDAHLTLQKLIDPDELSRMYDTFYQRLFHMSDDTHTREITNYFYEILSTPTHSAMCTAPWEPFTDAELDALKEKQSVCLEDPNCGEKIYLCKAIFGDVKKTERIVYMVLPADLMGEQEVRTGKRYALFRQTEPSLDIYTLLSFASIGEDQ